MDFFYFLSSINKLSLLAFLIVLGFLVYEIYLFKKEKEKKSQPLIPRFEENFPVSVDQGRKIFVSKKDIKTSTSKNYLLVILIILSIFLGTVTILGFIKFNQPKLKIEEPTPSPIVTYITSKGIKIFNSQWKLLSKTELSKLKPGEKIIIGIETIKESDIDYARIRVNKNTWEGSDITRQLDVKKNIFYIEYIIATGSTRLKIEAQLHSKTDGWLGE